MFWIQKTQKIHAQVSHQNNYYGIHSQRKHIYRNTFGDSHIQYHDFDSQDSLTFCPPICLCWLLVRKEKKFLCAVTVCLYSVSHVVHPL